MYISFSVHKWLLWYFFCLYGFIKIDIEQKSYFYFLAGVHGRWGTQNPFCSRMYYFAHRWFRHADISIVCTNSHGHPTEYPPTRSCSKTYINYFTTKSLRKRDRVSKNLRHRFWCTDKSCSPWCGTVMPGQHHLFRIIIARWEIYLRARVWLFNDSTSWIF